MRSVQQAVTIGDLQELARRRSPGFVFMPMETGCGEGLGPARNVRGFDGYLLNARAQVDASAPSQAVTLFGRRYASPFGLSAVGMAANLRRHADQIFAEAAVEADIPFMLSGLSCAPIEEIARIAPHHVWQQLYLARDLAISADMLRRGRDAGVQVLVVTVDAQLHIHNHWLLRRGIRLPVAVAPRSWPYVLWQGLTHPGWSWDVVRQGGLPAIRSFAPYAPAGAGTQGIARAMLAQIPGAHNWDAIERVRALWPGTLVVKGIMDPRDAVLALNAGADAVTVSNHGGNKLDMMPAAIGMLGDVVDAVDAVAGHAVDVGARAPVLFDGGIRRGSDIITALGLGASFCMLGRATLYGAMADGLRGVLRAIEILRSDVRRTQVMMGCPDVARIPRDLIRSAGQGTSFR